MEKGKLGLRMSFYAVTGFLLAILGYSTLLFLLAGVVLIVEKSEWATRQMIQAFSLCVISSLLYDVLGILDFIYKIPFIGTAWGVIMSVIKGIIGLVVFAFCVVGIINTAKGKEANIPLASKFADWAFGVVKKAAPVQPAANTTPVQPTDNTGSQQ